ncbi:MAG: ATP-binding protein [Clostridia bacterium]|nr:ATP-binding protein [Clostridia bacterium]
MKRKHRFPLYLKVAASLIACITLALGLAFGLLAASARSMIYNSVLSDIRHQNQDLAELIKTENSGFNVSIMVLREMASIATREDAMVFLVMGDPQNPGSDPSQNFFRMTPNVGQYYSLSELSDYFIENIYMPISTNHEAWNRTQNESKYQYILGTPITDRMNNPGMLITVVQVENLDAVVTSWYRIFSGATITALTVALGAALITATSLTRPLKRMLGTVRALERGRLETRTAIKSRDEIGELAEGINAMAASLADAQRAQAFFMASVSHELRAPLTSIQGFVAAVRDGTAEGAAAEESLDIVLAECDRLSRLIEVLMTLMRAAASDMPLEREWTDVKELLTRCAGAIGGKARERGVTFEIEAAQETGAMLNAPLMQQVFYNILDNALRYSPEGGKVTLAARQEKHITVFWVDDRGPGLPEEEATRMFDDFVTDNAARTPGGGIGLGLSIARRVVESHGGEIRAETNPEGGCRIAFYVVN